MMKWSMTLEELGSLYEHEVRWLWREPVIITFCCKIKWSLRETGGRGRFRETSGRGRFRETAGRGREYSEVGLWGSAH